MLLFRYLTSLDSSTASFFTIFLVVGHIHLISAFHKPSLMKGPKPKAIRTRALRESEYKISCAPASYADGMTCRNGKMPPKIEEASLTQDYIEKKALWQSVDNGPTIDKVKKLAEDCSSSCSSGACFYSMEHLDYICGSRSSKEYKGAQEDFEKLRLTHFNYGLLPDGMICWAGKLQGHMYDPKFINQADSQMAEWYKNKVTDEKVFEIQMSKELGNQCRSKKCKFGKKRASFICTALNVGIRPSPMSISILLWLQVCLTLIRFWTDYGAVLINYVVMP